MMDSSDFLVPWQELWKEYLMRADPSPATTEGTLILPDLFHRQLLNMEYPFPFHPYYPSNGPYYSSPHGPCYPSSNGPYYSPSNGTYPCGDVNFTPWSFSPHFDLTAGQQPLSALRDPWCTQQAHNLPLLTSSSFTPSLDGPLAWNGGATMNPLTQPSEAPSLAQSASSNNVTKPALAGSDHVVHRSPTSPSTPTSPDLQQVRQTIQQLKESAPQEQEKVEVRKLLDKMAEVINDYERRRQTLTKRRRRASSDESVADTDNGDF